jgi:hypothetical protein
MNEVGGEGGEGGVGPVHQHHLAQQEKYGTSLLFTSHIKGW